MLRRIPHHRHHAAAAAWMTRALDSCRETLHPLPVDCPQQQTSLFSRTRNRGLSFRGSYPCARCSISRWPLWPSSSSQRWLSSFSRSSSSAIKSDYPAAPGSASAADAHATSECFRSRFPLAQQASPEDPPGPSSPPRIVRRSTPSPPACPLQTRRPPSRVPFGSARP